MSAGDGTRDILAAIDGALSDPSVSGDAMRWTPDPPEKPPPAQPPALVRTRRLVIREEFSDGRVREAVVEDPATVDWAVDMAYPEYPWEHLYAPTSVYLRRGMPTITVSIRPGDHPLHMTETHP